MRSSHMIAQLAPAPRHEIALTALTQRTVLTIVVLQYTEVLRALKLAPRTLERLNPGGVSQRESFHAVLGMCPSHVIVKSVPVDEPHEADGTLAVVGPLRVALANVPLKIVVRPSGGGFEVVAFRTSVYLPPLPLRAPLGKVGVGHTARSCFEAEIK